MRQAWYGFWIRLAFLLRLRGLSVRLQRWLKRETKAPRAPLESFPRPEAIEEYVSSRFEYRDDETRIGGWTVPLDWVTDPEVFQARLDSDEKRDGDCDDFAFWVANVLLDVPGVEVVYLVSAGFPGGGHTFCVYRYHGGWFLFDYRISELRNPNDAPERIAHRYFGEGTEVYWYAFETVEPPWRLAATCPKGRVSS